jgi:23S rRNA maturation mini-RNase III
MCSHSDFTSCNGNNLSDLILILSFNTLAEFQARLLSHMRTAIAWNDQEVQVLARGRNAVSGGSRNRRDPAAYQEATALEALIGYLYLTNTQRCAEIFEWIDNNMDRIYKEEEAQG